MADDEQWYRMTAYWDSDKETVIEVGDGDEVYVRGKIGDLPVVQMPKDVSGAEAVALMKAAKPALEAAGIESAIIIPGGVQFLRLCKSDPPGSLAPAPDDSECPDESDLH